MYRQMFSNTATGYSYVSDLLDWWTEQRPGGGTYVHFEGMKLCDFEEECKETRDIIGPDHFYDFCEDRTVNFSGEMIVSVAGSKPYVLSGGSPRGIVLVEMKPPGWEGPYYFFVLQPAD